MNLTKLSVTNFKCFNDSELNFSKLNIFTGRNSSGKSSMLNAILSVSQSGRQFPYGLTPNGKYIVMGDYYEFVNNHDKTKPIGIDIVLQEGKEKYDLHTTWRNDESTNMPVINTIDAKAEFIQLTISKKQNYQVRIQFDVEELKRSAVFENAQRAYSLIDQLTDGRWSKGVIKEFRNVNVEKSHNTVAFQVNDLRDISGVLVTSNMQFVDWAFSPIMNTVRQFDSNFNYISSFRIKPERTYTQRSGDNSVEPNGANTIDQLFQWKASKSPKFKELITELRNLQLINRLAIDKFRGGRYEVRVRTTSSSASASLVDVGFGISQFLPVIVADLQLRDDSTLMIDQPEMHLHPSAQAQLVNYFIHNIKTKKKKYFIETHSEYILNRLRASIVKGMVSPSLVKVFYFENQGNDTKIHQIKFTKDGRILNAPQEFFDTYMIDVMDIALNSEKT